MTVSVPEQLVFAYSGDGSTQIFSYPVRFLDDEELTVILGDADGVQTVQTLSTNYTVSDAGEANGGSVTMLTAPATGEKLYIFRATAAKQIVDLADGQRAPAQSTEDQLDRFAMALQDHAATLARSVKKRVGSDLAGEVDLPEPEADKIVGWNASGDALENKTPGNLGVTEIITDTGLAGGSNNNVPSTSAAKAYADTKVAKAATDASSFGFVLDEDDMASDSATKLPTQQSVSARINQKTTFASRASANGAAIAANITIARTAGYAAAGDGGDAEYVLSAVDQSMPGQWSPADGRFAEIIPAARYKPSPFGILPEDTGAAALINDVFDWMTRRRGGGIVELLPEDYYITETVKPLSGCGLIGAGGAGQYPTPDKVTSSNFLATEKTRLAAQSGFTDQYIVLVQPENLALYGIQGARLEGLLLDCANIAQRGLGWVSVKNSSVRDIMVFRPTGFGIVENVLAVADATTEGNNATQFNSWENVTVWAGDAASTATGIYQGGTSTNNVNQNSRRNIKVVHRDGIGIQIANADTDCWMGVNTTAIGSGLGLALGASNTDAAITARNITMIEAQFGISGPVTGGGVLAAAGTVGSSNKNVIYGYSLGNGAPLPTVQAGATLTVLTDTGQCFINGVQIIGSNGEVSGGRNIVAQTANVVITAAQNGTLFTNSGATASVQLNLPTAVRGMRYGFMVADSDGIVVQAASGEAIRIGGSVSSTLRRASSTTVGDVLWLTAVNSAAWIAENPAAGGWTLS